MLTIVHGDDTAASRTFFINAKKRSKAPITLEAEKLTLTDIVQVLDGGGLFGETQDIFIESLLTKKKKSKELTAIVSVLDTEQHANVYLWESKEVDKRTLSSLKTAKSQIFTLPKSLFQFLEGIKPNNPQLLPLYHKTLETVEAEMIFFMLIRQLRLLLAVSSRELDQIDEVKRMAPWQRSKLEKQSKFFRSGSLRTNYRKLFEIDRGQKTGTLVLPLSSAIDFWLLDL